MYVMSRFRLLVLLSGVGGLLASMPLAAVAARLVATDIISPLLPFRAVTLLFVVILAGFSLAEIPIMVFAMRRLLVERRGNHAIVLALNALYVFFATVYGVPLLLLTGDVGWGLALCSLGILRLVSSLIFVHEPVP
jgi:hypothetical protein